MYKEPTKIVIHMSRLPSGDYRATASYGKINVEVTEDNEYTATALVLIELGSQMIDDDRH